MGGCSCEMKPSDQNEHWACGSRNVFIGASCCTAIIGIVLVIIPIVVGGCSCAGECASKAGDCTSYFDGCKKGGYDANKCVAAIFANMATHCDKDECKYGGMSGGATLGLLGFGIVLLVISCITCCGICPCLCFQNAVPQGPIVAAATVTGVGAAPPPPPAEVEK